jgi:hypothetical protein
MDKLFIRDLHAEKFKNLRVQKEMNILEHVQLNYEKQYDRELKLLKEREGNKKEEADKYEKTL